MSFIPVLKNSTLRRCVVNTQFHFVRPLHKSSFVLTNNNNNNNSFNSENSSDNDNNKVNNDIDNDNDNDNLKHLYKKKYEFIQKQNLEDSYNQLHKFHKEHPDKDYYNEENSSSSSNKDEATFQLTQKIKLLSAGLIAVVLTLSSLQIYQNWSFIKSKYLLGNQLESFDEMYDRIKEKKKKKQEALEKFSTTITNPNDTSIPGIYICGNNENNLISNNSQYNYIPIFKRLDIFDNFLIKDLTIGSKSGALIDDKGDLYQWGKGFNGNSKIPTIKGKNLKKVQISNNTIYVLSEYGEIFYLPENFQLQNQIKNKQKGWLNSYNVNYFKLNLPRKNLIIDISAGLQHLVLLDKNGSVLTTATGYNTELNKSFGQFGLPEFSQFDKPPKINEVHEVVLLNKYMKNGKILNRKIKQISAGDNFTLCLDKAGTVWAFGQNTHGAIGSIINYDTEIIPYPTEVKFISNHFKKNEFPRCININAGGDTAFATFTSSNIYELFEKSIKEDSNHFDNKFTFDTINEAEENKLHLSWGNGLKGELGLGYFIHGSYEPKKIKVLNDIKEFNETTNKLEKIGVKSWSVGKNHIIVTLMNNDVYVWGDNEYGQLGNGKRIRSGAPTTIPSILEPNSNEIKLSHTNNRLQLLDNGKFHQEIIAGRDTTAIVYKRN